MGTGVTGFATGTLGINTLLNKGASGFMDDVLGIETPSPPPAPTIEPVSPTQKKLSRRSMQNYTKKSARNRQGRSSTILGSQKLGSTYSQKMG